MRAAKRGPTTPGGPPSPKVLSDLEFEPEIQRISTILNDKGNWDKRLGALKDLHAVVLGDISTKRNFQPVMSATLKITLKAQVEDLRSAISREACAVVRALVANSENKTNWEFVSDWFVPSLFNNSAVTIAAISQAAEETLRAIAACGYLSRHAMNTFLNTCSNKHATIRRHAYQCLLLILQNCDPSITQKHSTKICDLVRAGVHDADQEARKLSRMCFWALEDICMDEAVMLFDGCEPNVQKAIEQEKATFFAWMQDGEMPLPSPKKRPGAVAAPRQQAPPSPTDEASGAGRPASRFADKRAPREQGNRPGSASSMQDQSNETPKEPAVRKPPTPTSVSSKHRDPAGGDRPPSYAARQRTATPKAPGVASRAPRSRSADPNANEDSWIQIQSTVNSSDWSARVNAFMNISELAEMDALTPQKAIEVVSLVVKHSNDTHYRVVAGAFLCLEKLLERMPEQVLPQVEKLLNCLLLRVVDPKESVRQVSQKLLEKIPVAFGAENILSSALKVVESSNPKVRLGAIEYLLHLSQSAPQYFSAASNMKHFLQKLLVVATRLSPNDVKIQKATGLLLAQLYACGADIFVLLVVALPVPDREEVANLIKQHVPHIQQDVRRASQGERLLPHPEVVVSSPFGKSPASVGGPGGARSPAKASTAKKSPAARTTPPPENRRSGNPKPLSPATLLYDYDEEGNEVTPEQYQTVETQRMDEQPRPSSTQQRQSYNARAFDGAAPHNADGYRNSNRPSGAAHQQQTTFSALLGHKKQVPDEINALRNASSSDEKRAAILDIGDALQLRQRLWEDHYDKILPFALAFVNDADHLVRQLSLQWLVAIQEERPLLTQPNDSNLDHFLRCAAVAMDDPFPEVQEQGRVLLSRCIELCPLGASVAELLDVCQEIGKNAATSTKVFQSTLRTLGELTCRDGQAGVEQWIHRSLGPLVEFFTVCFGDEHSDIRKTIVLNFVDLYSLLGADLLPHIKHLSVSQLKLISIYYNRTMDTGRGVPQTDLMKEMQALGII